MSGQQHHRQIWIDGAELGHQVQAIAIRQPLVEDREVGIAVLHRRERLLEGLGLQHCQIGKGLGDRAADGGFVIDDEEGFGHVWRLAESGWRSAREEPER